VGISDGEIPREVSYILERRHYVALNREQFLSIENKAPVEVALPGEGTVFVRIMSGLDREQFGETCKQLSDDGKPYCVQALLVVFCACDENSIRLFTEKDLLTLSAMDSTLLEVVYKAASELNAVGVHTESAEKNSVTAPIADSPTV
jgi:hypothetical protein